MVAIHMLSFLQIGLLLLNDRLYIAFSFHNQIHNNIHVHLSKRLTNTSTKQQRNCNKKREKKCSWLLFGIESENLNRVINKDNKPNESIDVVDDNNNNNINPIFKELNPSQLKAVTSPINEISCVIAGPGAGKTRVLTSRIAYLLGKTSSPKEKKAVEQILAVTFTKKASSEMKNRLHSMMINNNKSEQEQEQQQKLFNRVTIGTFHSICGKILRLHGKLLSTLPYIQEYIYINQEEQEKDTNQTTSATIDGTFVILDTSDQLKIIKKIIKEENLLEEHQDSSSSTINNNQILNYLSKITMQRLEELLSIQSTKTKAKKSFQMKKNPNEIIAKQIHSSYLKQLFTTNTLDFDHLINLSLLLIHQYPTTIQKSLQNQYKHILVDEFQDTSLIQSHFIRLLSTNSLMVVGDSDQSIYSWRGAYPSAMYDFIQEWGDGNVQTFYLMENYRSTKNIILAAQKVINANNDLPQSSSITPHSSSTRDGSRSKELRQNMIPMKGKGPPPRIISFKDSDEEAEFIVQNVFKLITSNQLSSTSTVAVIYRTNAQSRTIEERCVANRLRYRVRGAAGKFYSRAEIKDSLCFLRLFNNGNDRQALLRAVDTPKGRGIGASTMKEFWMYYDYMKRQRLGNDDNTVLDILLTLSHDNSANKSTNTNKIPDNKILSKRSYNNLSSFANEMKLFMNTFIDNQRTTILLPDLFQNIINFWELKKQIKSLSKSNQEYDNRWSNVMELGIGLEKYRKGGPCMISSSFDALSSSSSSLLSRFLDDIALLEDESEDATVEDAGGNAISNIIVNLMTIHAAKGLEFDAVFLVGNEDGVFPTKQSMMKGPGSLELEEERRLCYVAMTRAKEFLFLTWRKEVRMFYSNGVKTTDMQRSRFLGTLIAASGKKRKKRNDASSPVLDKNKIKLLKTSVHSPLNRVKDRPVATNKSNSIKENTRRLMGAPQVRTQSNLNTSTILQKRMVESDSRNKIKRKSRPIQEISEMNDKKSKLNTSGISRQRIEQNKAVVRNREQRYTKISEEATLRRSIAATKTQSSSSNDNRKSAIDKVDSTFFYPIGSAVVHKIHGIGTILQPPPSTDNNKDYNIIIVKFEKNGLKLTFPLLNNGLKRRFSH